MATELGIAALLLNLKTMARLEDRKRPNSIASITFGCLLTCVVDKRHHAPYPVPMSATSPTTTLPFKISVLVFIKDSQGRFLLICRRKTPNKDRWSPIGGKLEMTQGESPFECAVRETGEET